MNLLELIEESTEAWTENGLGQTIGLSAYIDSKKKDYGLQDAQVHYIEYMMSVEREGSAVCISETFRELGDHSIHRLWKTYDILREKMAKNGKMLLHLDDDCHRSVDANHSRGWCIVRREWGRDRWDKLVKKWKYSLEGS